jgi:hypothetical protein
MEDYTNNIGYKTYYLGVPDDIKDCKRIRLYYSKKTPITLVNLLDVHDLDYPDNISGIKDDQKILKKHDEGYFEIDCSENVISFDTIIYLSTVDEKPVGFTKFNNLQQTEIDGYNSRILKLRLYIEFEIRSGKLQDGSIKLINSLSSLSSEEVSDYLPDLAKRLLEDKTDGSHYTCPEEIRNHLSETPWNSYRRFTNYLGDLISDSTYCSLTDSTVITGGLDDRQRYRFYINSDFPMNNYNTSFNKFFIGSFKKDLALYQWDSENYRYRVVSLTKSNSFNLPQELLVLPKDMESVLKNLFTNPSERGYGYELNYMAGGHAVFYKESSDQWAIMSLTRSDFTELPNGKDETEKTGVSIDPWDENESIIFFSKEKRGLFYKQSKIYKEFLGISLPSGIDVEKLHFLGKIGSWFKFKGFTDKQEFIAYSNSHGSILFSPEENILPVNNKCILSQTINQKDTDYEFYFVSGGNSVRSDSFNKAAGTSLSNDSEYKIAFNSKIGRNEDQTERRCLIDGLRKKPILDYTLPNTGFISSYSGILFYEYEDENKERKINYL